MTRPTPPPLELQDPLCGLCGDTVQTDCDGYRCVTCQIDWPADEVGVASGEWIVPDAAHCPSIDGRFLQGGCWSRSSGLDPSVRRCMLAHGHVHEHIHYERGTDRRFCWTDRDAATAEQLEWARAAVTP